MKNKTLMMIFLVVFILLLYNLFCYSLVNKIIYKKTNPIITNYLSDLNINNYKFVKAINNTDETISVYVKINNDFYNFVLENNNYQIKDVNNNIPDYIKSPKLF